MVEVAVTVPIDESKAVVFLCIIVPPGLLFPTVFAVRLLQALISWKMCFVLGSFFGCGLPFDD